MHIRLIAVGDRQPRWVDDAFAAYSEAVSCAVEVPPGYHPHRPGETNRATPPGRSRQEADAILGKLEPGEQAVLLDERGKQLTSKGLAERLQNWQADGRDLAFIIGGPDGVAEGCRERADFTWSLSELTLPHGLARVLLAEQLYRAWSLATGIPIIASEQTLSAALHLASSSPRRAAILRRMGLEFTAAGVDIDERQAPGETADTMVLRLASEKARAAPRDARARS